MKKTDLKSIYPWLAALIIPSLLLSLSACNLPGHARSTESGVALIFTAAAQTERALLTATNFPATTPGTPSLPGTQDLPATPVPGSTATGVTTAVAACDAGKFVGDVTFPDNSDVAPGQAFVKTWKLQNTGACPWTSAYTAVFVGGDSMGAPASVPVSTGSVAPGETVELSISFIAPQKVGRYRSEWRLRNASGQVFGLGKDEKPFWAQVDVVTASGITFDFIAKASQAEWHSGPGNDLNVNVPFNGPVDDPNGAARIEDRITMEDGSTSGKLLLMVPKHENNGAIAGVFPPYTVQPGDRLIAFLGFMQTNGSCADANARFVIQAQESDAKLNVGEWTASCDGRMDKIDLDLTSLYGKTVRFIFLVNAGDRFSGDYAIWNSARIEN